LRTIHLRNSLVKKESSAHKEKGSNSAAHRQHWRQERKNVRENKRYMGGGLD